MPEYQIPYSKFYPGSRGITFVADTDGDAIEIAEQYRQKVVSRLKEKIASAEMVSFNVGAVEKGDSCELASIPDES